MTDPSQSPTCGKPTTGGPCVRVARHAGLCQSAVGVFSAALEPTRRATALTLSAMRVAGEEGIPARDIAVTFLCSACEGLSALGFTRDEALALFDYNWAQAKVAP